MMNTVIKDRLIYIIDTIIGSHLYATLMNDNMPMTSDIHSMIIGSIYFSFSKDVDYSFIEKLDICPINLHEVLDEEDSRFLEENYKDIISLCVKDSDVLNRLSYDVDGQYYANCLSAELVKRDCDSVFVYKAGFNIFCEYLRCKSIYGVEPDKKKWAIGQIYLQAINRTDIIIFNSEEYRDCPKSDLVVLLGNVEREASLVYDVLERPNDEYIFINHMMKKSGEYIIVLPKIDSVSDKYIKWRSDIIDDTHLYSATTMHYGRKGYTVLHGTRHRIGINKRRTIKSVLLHDSRLGKESFFILLLARIMVLLCIINAFVPVIFPLRFTTLLWSLITYVCLHGTIYVINKPRLSDYMLALSNVYDIEFASEKEICTVAKHIVKIEDAANKGAICKEEELIEKCLLSGKTYDRSYLKKHSSAFLHMSEVEYGKYVMLNQLVELVVPSFSSEIADALPVIEPSVALLTNDYLDSKVYVTECAKGNAGYLIPGKSYLICEDPYSLTLRVAEIKDSILMTINPNKLGILVFKIKEDSSLLVPEFLLKQLTDSLIRQQLVWFSNLEVAMNYIQIVLPDSKYQNEALRSDLYSRLEEEHDRFQRTIRERKHELGNLIREVKGSYRVIKLHLDKNGSITDTDMITQSRYTKRPILDYFQNIEDGFMNIGNMLQNFYSEGYGAPEIINIKESIDAFFRSRFQNNYNVDCSEISVEHHAAISRKAFESIIRNVVINAEKHGFLDNSRMDYCIRFKSIVDNDNTVLYISNNGNCIASDLNVESIFEDGVGTGNSEHRGCGDMRKLCEMYHGTARIAQINSEDNFNIVYIITLPTKINDYVY